MIVFAARYVAQWFLEVLRLVFHPKELASGLKNTLGGIADDYQTFGPVTRVVVAGAAGFTIYTIVRAMLR